MVFNISLVESIIPGGGERGTPLYRVHPYALISIEWGSWTLLVWKQVYILSGIQIRRKERDMHIRNEFWRIFCLRSNRSNDDIISAQNPGLKRGVSGNQAAHPHQKLPGVPSSPWEYNNLKLVHFKLTPFYAIPFCVGWSICLRMSNQDPWLGCPGSWQRCDTPFQVVDQT